jgi:hypothetical protein
MTHEALTAIVLHELGLVEDDLTPDERIKLAIDIAIRLLTLSIDNHR